MGEREEREGRERERERGEGERGGREGREREREGRERVIKHKIKQNLTNQDYDTQRK